MTTITKAHAVVEITGKILPEYETVLTREALQFVALLHKKFNKRREELLSARQARQRKIEAGELPTFLESTAHIRQSDWKVGNIPADLLDRQVEITGPTDRKMVINALNSGAKVFMADFEDANSPTWTNMVEGQINLYKAIRRKIDYTAENGKNYALNEKVAVLFARPRGWHLLEKHVLVDGEAVSGSIFDFALYFYHNVHELLKRGSGPYYYLPKMESHLEARLWNDIFVEAQIQLGIPQGTIKSTVLIETILAAFEMDEILFELREHIVALNAGRWDYIFSVIKKFRNNPNFLLPDRGQVTMTVPFMRSYAKLLVKTCHKRGAFAMGGMSAFIPSRKDEEINKTAFAKVKSDKELESTTGFDGTWVAHPDLVPVAAEIFAKVLDGKPNQADKQLPEVEVTAEQLLDTTVEGGQITEAGLRANINVAILYIASWLQGVGAAALHNLMEDAATAEISRAQVWQWLHLPNVKTTEGKEITTEYYNTLFAEEVAKIKEAVGGEENFKTQRYARAASIFDHLVKSPNFEQFLTLPAYNVLDLKN